MTLKLEFPNEMHREMYDDLTQELDRMWVDLSHPDNIFAFRGKEYWELVRKKRQDFENPAEWRVRSTSFFLIDTDREKILGAIQIRHSIDHPNLIHRGWHIGYAIRPNERKKWYATKMLELALKESKKIGLEKVLITCDIDNIASNKVIKIIEESLKRKQLIIIIRDLIDIG